MAESVVEVVETVACDEDKGHGAVVVDEESTDGATDGQFICGGVIDDAG